MRPLLDSPKIGKIPRREIAAAVRAVHVVPQSDGGWAVKKSGYKRIDEHFETKQEAEQFACQLSRDHHIKLIIHDKDGKD